MTGRRFSPGTPVSSTNKTDRHYIAEILLKVALNTHIPIPLYYVDLFAGIMYGFRFGTWVLKPVRASVRSAQCSLHFVIQMYMLFYMRSQL